MVPLTETKKDQFLEAFEALRKKGFAKDLAREKAIQYFSDRGFPTMRDEQWKYTNLSALRDTRFDFISEPVSKVSKEALNRLLPFQSDAYRLVFVDGIFSGALSEIGTLPKGVLAGSFQEAVKNRSFKAESYLERLDFDHNPLAALNTAFFRDGAFVRFGEGVCLQKPVELVFVSASARPLASFPRNLIVAERNSKADVIESYLFLSPEPYFTNTTTKIVLEESASLNHLKFQREGSSAFHVSTTQVNQKKDSVFSSACVDLGGKLVRHNLNVSLDGEGAQTHLFGLYLTEGDQHVDNSTFISHPAQHGTSRQLYKGILSGKSTAVFSGKIFVHKDAQKTDAAQTNKNLLLSEEAAVDTKPHLEIFADDVKCTHGAAVGQLDEDAIFYFKTRGLDEKTARKVLCYGFANEVIENIPVESIRGPLAKLILGRLEKQDGSK